MMNILIKKAREKGIKTIRGHYYKTAKNNMVKDLYGEMGFDKVSENDNGDSLWVLETAKEHKLNYFIDVKES